MNDRSRYYQVARAAQRSDQSRFYERAEVEVEMKDRIRCYDRAEAAEQRLND
jgi:hypothetical protein